jgi:uncharacterized protein (TIGR03437 family)
MKVGWDRDGRPCGPRFCALRAGGDRGSSWIRADAGLCVLPLAPDPQGRRQGAVRVGLARGGRLRRDAKSVSHVITQSHYEAVWESGKRKMRQVKTAAHYQFERCLCMKTQSPFVALALCLASQCALSQSPQSEYRISSQFSVPDFGENLPAIDSIISNAGGLAVDSNGNIFIADAGQHRVRAVSRTGVIRTVSGSGTRGYSGDFGSAIAAQLSSPSCLAISRGGELFIADSGNGVVRRVDTQGIITTYAGGGFSAPGNIGDGILAVNVRFNSLRCIALDSTGTLYVSDSGDHRVYAVSADGILRKVAGDGTRGAGPANIDAVNSSLDTPAGMWADFSGRLFVAEAGARRIMVISKGKIGIYGPATSLIPLIGTPLGVTMDDFGTMFVVGDKGTAKRKLDGEILAFSSGGSVITIDRVGNAIVGDHSAILRFAADNQVNVVAGQDSAAGLGRTRSSVPGRWMGSPVGLAYDSRGNLYISDEASHQVRMVAPDGNLTIIAGVGAPGYSGDGDIATRAYLHSPKGICVDRDGNLLVADSGNHVIRRINRNGFISTFAGSSRRGLGGDGGDARRALLNWPSAVALDPANGDLYVADTGNSRIRKISSIGTISTVVGTEAGLAGDGSPATTAKLSRPSDIAISGSGVLVIADTGNGRIRVVDRVGHINTVGPTSFELLRSVAILSTGDIVVADSGRHTVGTVTLSGNTYWVAGNGIPGFSGDHGPALQASLNTPAGLAVDASGTIRIADSGNGRVRELVPANMSGSSSAGDPSPLALVHSTTGKRTLLTPGLLVSAFGSFLGPPLGVELSSSDDASRETLSGVEVRVNEIAATILYASQSQINFVVPYRVGTSGRVIVEVYYQGVLRGRVSSWLAGAAPGIIEASITNESGVKNSLQYPAVRESYVYADIVGVGQLISSETSSEGSGRHLTMRPSLPMQLFLGDRAVQIAFSESFPLSPGVFRLKFRTPGGFFPSGSHQLRIRLGSNESDSGALVYVR